MERLNVKMSVHPKLIYKFHVTSIEPPLRVFAKPGQAENEGKQNRTQGRDRGVSEQQE